MFEDTCDLQVPITYAADAGNEYAKDKNMDVISTVLAAKAVAIPNGTLVQDEILLTVFMLYVPVKGLKGFRPTDSCRIARIELEPTGNSDR